MSFKYVIKVMIVCCVVSIAALGQQPAQRVYSRADFINVDGGSLTDRIGRAVRQFKDSKAGDSVWLIYQFPINELISIGPFSGNVYHDGDGIRLVRQDNPQGAAVVLLAETTGSQPVFTRVKTLDMSEPYVFEDRPVYWLGSAQADESVSQLDAILRSQPADKVLVRGSLRAIGAHKSGRVVTLLKGYIEKEPTLELQRNAVSYLGRVGTSESLDALLALFEGNNNEGVKEEVINALGRHNDKRAGDKLLAIAKNDPNPKFRQSAIRRLSSRSNLPFAVNVR